MAFRSGKKLQQRLPNLLVKAAVKRIMPQKFHQQPGVPNKGAQNPRHLTAQQKVTRQPSEQGERRAAPARSHVLEKPIQTPSPRPPRKSDQTNMRQERHAVPKTCSLRSQRRRVPQQKESKRRQGQQHQSRHRKTQQDRQSRLPKAQARRENLRQDPIEQSISTAGKQHHQRKLDSRIDRLQLAPPQPNSSPISATAQRDRSHGEAPRPRRPRLQPSNQVLRSARQQLLDAPA